MSIRNRVASGAALSSYDAMQTGSGMSLRSFMRFGAGFSLGGQTRVDSITKGYCSVAGTTNVGSSLSLRASMQI